MTARRIRLAAIAAALLALAVAPASAQKTGGVLHVAHRDSPASMSPLEEVTISTVAPMMAVFSNLVLFDQHVPQNTMASIVPDLADGWSWNADGTELTFRLHQGVKWHDGQPFTAKDVQCTWDLLLGKAAVKFRINPRRSWYWNLDRVTISGDYEAIFHLKQKQPAFVALLASGYSPVYPCHVPPAEIRQHPIGTGPFKFVSYKPNESIRLARNPDYWKPGRPYLDAIEWQIIPNRSTALLAFVTGQLDMTFPYEVTIPLLKDIKSQAPEAICELRPRGVASTLIVNRDAPPFDNAELRRAMALTVDRKTFIDVLSEGQADIGAAMLPPPEGLWGMPPDRLKSLPGYDPDVAKSRAEARQIMQRLGYGPDKPLAVKVATRNIPLYRDPAVMLLDQLKEIYIAGDLDIVETANWNPKITRRDYMVGMENTGVAVVDDPDQQLYESYACDSDRNFTGYCNRGLEALFHRQSAEADPDKRKELVWQIDRTLQEEGARPVLYHMRGATCWHPRLKGLTTMVNSMYNGWRLEDVWLER
ncbi:MAG TPA: ABC transporter substrate-binding protein [Stellaceae bacterium]|nr:ABC transporter substrate-binding protein [Stellaceae bacterium]